LDQAVQDTRIAKRFLEALERNAPLDVYPAPIYARAFLREYARYLGIDPEPLVATLAAVSSPEEFKLASIKEAVPPPRRWPARVLLGLSVSLLLGLAVIGVASDHGPLPVGGPIPQHPVAAGPAPAQTQGSKAPAPPRPINGIRVAVRLSDRCWIEAVADGKQVFRGVVQPDQSEAFHARGTLQLTLGNAGGARLVVNGTDITTGGAGQVIHLSLTLRHGRVHVDRV